MSVTDRDTAQVIGPYASTERIYRAVAAHPTWGMPELSAELDIPESDVRDAIDQLCDLNLVRESLDHAGQLRPVDADAALRVLLAQHEELARSQAVLAQLVAARLSHPATGGDTLGVEQLRGMDAVQDRVAAVACATTDEILIMTPGSVGSAPALEAAWRNDAEILQPGVTTRAVALDSARNDPATISYVQRLAASGGQIRTATVLPCRAMVSDRRAALIPLDSTNKQAGALYITEPGIVEVIAALFEQVWSAAIPLELQLVTEGNLSRLERALLELLGVGLTDEAAAARLEVSQRTARRIMADLMDRLGARSRFEAGLRCAQQGWL